jgi:hypothetical protein
MEAALNRCMVLAGVVGCSLATAAVAEDYRLRLDAVGYVDAAADDEHSEETVLHSIEVVARPDTAFHGKAAFGTETVRFSGMLRRKEDGKFVLQMKYAHAVYRGTTVLAADGSRSPVPDRTSFFTTIAITEDEPLKLSYISNQKSKFGTLERKSSIHYVLALKKHEPMDD